MIKNETRLLLKFLVLSRKPVIKRETLAYVEKSLCCFFDEHFVHKINSSEELRWKKKKTFLYYVYMGQT